MLSLWIVAALVLGALVRHLGLPPLVGFLACGFALHSLDAQPSELLTELADAGVLVLLFSVGLKLRFKTLFSTEVLGAATTHLVIAGVLILLAIQGTFGFPLLSAAIVAVALTFSSTVFAAKVLDRQYELRSVHGRVAIGILIVQDLAAVAILALLAGRTPSPAAAAVLALPLLRPLVGRLLEYIGHGELLVLFGIAAALAVGGAGFEHLGLSPELGALLIGMLFAGHPRAEELSNAVWGLKEFMLVGFFLNIGLNAEFSTNVLELTVLILVLLPLKTTLFFALLIAVGLRARTSFLTTASLSTYSEFALIVLAGGVEQQLVDNDWVIATALAIAASFAVAALLNTYAHEIYGRFSQWLEQFERRQRHPDDEPVSLGSADILIVGMGRLGVGAYDYLHDRGELVVGADDDPGKLENNRKAGRRVIYADAEDQSFWDALNLSPLRAIMLTLPDPHAKRLAAKALRARGYRGLLSAAFVYPEEQEALLEAGCDVAYNYFTEAGVGFARDTFDELGASADAARAEASS